MSSNKPGTSSRRS